MIKNILTFIKDYVLLKIYSFGLKISFKIYKKVYYKTIVNAILNNLDLIKSDKNGIYITLDKESLKAINNLIYNDEEKLKQWSKCLYWVKNISVKFNKCLRKYLIKSLKYDYKHTSYLEDCFNNFLNKTCSYKRNKFIDKYIVTPLKKMTFDDKLKDKDISDENIRRFILDTMIELSKIDPDRLKNLSLHFYHVIETGNDDEIISIIFLAQLLQPINIVNYVIEHELKQKHELGSKLSNSMIRTLRKDNGYEFDPKNEPDYIIIDSILKHV